METANSRRKKVSKLPSLAKTHLQIHSHLKQQPIMEGKLPRNGKEKLFHPNGDWILKQGNVTQHTCFQ